MPETYADMPLLTPRFQAAFMLAGEAHEKQLRKSTSIPYLAHVMSVSALVLEAGGDEDAAIAALLHDTVEDSHDGDAMSHRIRTEFGPRVAAIVLACSDTVAVPGQTKPPWRQRKEEYIAHLRAETDQSALLVSACDKLHNARAIVADLRESGDEVWQRFIAPQADQLWYYRSLSEVLNDRLDNGVSRELGRTVALMEGGYGER